MFTDGPKWKYKEHIQGPNLGLRPANEKRRYKVTPSLIDWTQTYNQPWYSIEI